MMLVDKLRFIGFSLLGPSAFEGPQKHYLTMFLEYNIYEQVPSDLYQNHSVKKYKEYEG
jgi:hypothetical protein